MGNGIVDLQFLTRALDEEKRSVLYLRRFALGETDPCTLWVRGWVGHSVGLDAVKQINIFLPLRKERLCGQVVRVPGYRSRVRFPALQEKSSGAGTGSTQPREYN
jgi:hypothetical protein